MIKVGFNFGKEILCPLCLKFRDDQIHFITSCENLVIEDTSIFNYQDIFKNEIKNAQKIADITVQKIQRRNQILNK